MALMLLILLSMIQVDDLMAIINYNCSASRTQDYTPFFIQSVSNGKYLDVAHGDSSLGTNVIAFRKRSFEFRNQSLIADMCSGCAFRLMITKRDKGSRCLSSNSIDGSVLLQPLVVTTCQPRGSTTVYAVRLLVMNELGQIFFYNDSFVLTTDFNTDVKVASKVWIDKVQTFFPNKNQLWQIVGGPKLRAQADSTHSACTRNLVQFQT